MFLSNNFTSFDAFVDTTEANFGFDDVTNEALGKSIYQHFMQMPSAQGRVIQASSWVIDGMPAGLAFREGKQGQRFGGRTPFLLHTVEKQADIGPYKFKMNSQMKKLRQEIYGKNA